MDGSAVGNAVPGCTRDSASVSSTPRLELVRSQPDREGLTHGGDTVAERCQPVVAGQLTVHWERQDAMSVLRLSGTLDQATVTLLDRELDGQAIGLTGLLVDLTGLHFIDSPGLDALVGIHWRASKRGDRLTFRHGTHIAPRPVELTRAVRLRSPSGGGYHGRERRELLLRARHGVRLTSTILGLVLDPKRPESVLGPAAGASDARSLLVASLAPRRLCLPVTAEPVAGGGVAR
jgi:anti-anti-sigma factor